jgi:hypothetical protein
VTHCVEHHFGMNLPTTITAALDALEACNPSYSASAAKARIDVERAIREGLSPGADPRSAAALSLVSRAPIGRMG